MSVTELQRRSLSLLDAVGGWRAIVEGIVGRAAFLVAYLLSRQVALAAAIGVGAALALAAVRIAADGRHRSVVIGVGMVGFSAALAGFTGDAVDFYLPGLLIQGAAAVALGASMLLGWPAVGLAVGAARGQRVGWRRDRRLRWRYQRCTAVFLVKCAVAAAVMAPLYLTGQVIPLAVAAVLLNGAPAVCACIYLCWRLLRLPSDSPAGSPPADP